MDHLCLVNITRGASFFSVGLNRWVRTTCHVCDRYAVRGPDEPMSSVVARLALLPGQPVTLPDGRVVFSNVKNDETGVRNKVDRDALRYLFDEETGMVFVGVEKTKHIELTTCYNVDRDYRRGM